MTETTHPAPGISITRGPTYTIIRAGDGAAIHCWLCDAFSVLPGDVANAYCGRCHLFHDAILTARQLTELGWTHVCAKWRTGRGACAVCERLLPPERLEP